MKRIVGIATAVLALTMAARAETPTANQEGLSPGSAQVARALDKKLEQVTIHGEALPAALAQLGEEAGIRITIEDESADLLPWGPQTRLKAVNIEDASLAEVLPQVLGALGMTYKVQDDGVLVVASEPLKRINRRSTWDDLKLLRRCCEAEYSPETFSTFRLQYRITNKVDAPKMFMTQLSKAGRGTVAEMMEVATGALGWVWFPDGDRLVIRTSEAQIANLMSRRITARYTNQPLSRILVDLATKAETPIHFEPGMMLKLPQTTSQSYTLLLRETSIRQAFELISAETGLKYDIRRDGVYTGLSDEIGGTTPARRGSQYVGKISIPSGDGTFTYEFLLRSDELPDDVLEHRRQLIEEYVQKMRRDMAPNESAPQP
jgi:hypothetical protein